MDEELYHIFMVARNIVAPWRDLCCELVPWLPREHAHVLLKQCMHTRMYACMPACVYLCSPAHMHT